MPGIARVDVAEKFLETLDAMEKSRVVDILELVALSGPAVPCEYPDGPAGEFLREPANQGFPLLLGAIAMYGSDSPWSLPHSLASRLGAARFDAATLAGMDEADIRKGLAVRPTLHKDAAKMGRWASLAAKMVAGQYGSANWIWDDYRRIDAGRLVGRLKGVPGIGAVKALVFAFLLGRDWGADICGWERFEMRLDPPMSVAADRMGVASSLPKGDPGKLVMVHEGLRSIAKRYCVPDGPRCGECPISVRCSRQGV